MANRSQITWKSVSYGVGLTIVMVVLVLLTASFVLQRPLDHEIVLALLVIAAGLFGLPSGYTLVRKNGNGG